MKTRVLAAGHVALFILTALAAKAAEPTTLFTPVRGSRIRLEGTANVIHTTWYVEGEVIGGELRVGPGFPTEPGQAVTPGNVQVQAANVSIQVRSLNSVEADGSLYSDKMDEVMYQHLKEDKYHVIRCHLTELTLKEAPNSRDAPYVFDSKGELAFAGITNSISMPFNILPLEGQKLKITGSATVRMSDYKVGPVGLAMAGIGIKTGDEVKLNFEWMVKQRAVPGTAASK